MSLLGLTGSNVPNRNLDFQTVSVDLTAGRSGCTINYLVSTLQVGNAAGKTTGVRVGG